MNLLFLPFGQLIALAGATQITKLGRVKGCSYGKVSAIGLAISATLAGYGAFIFAPSAYCVEREAPELGSRCLQYEDRRSPGEVFWGSMMGTVPVGLLSLLLRRRYERKELPDLERLLRNKREMEDTYRQFMKNWVATERYAWHKLQNLRDGYRGGGELITLAAAAAEQSQGFVSIRLDFPDEVPRRPTPAQLRKFAAECKSEALLDDGDVKLLSRGHEMISLGWGKNLVLTLKFEEEAFRAEVEGVKQ